jgi:hypothetical protein
MKNLEKFIDMHRNEFDVYQPAPEVWVGISSGLTASALLSKLAKFFGSGPKNLVLTFAVTSTILGVGIWAYQPDRLRQAAIYLPQPATTKEAPAAMEAPGISEAPEVKSKAPVPQNTKQIPLSIAKDTSENKEPLVYPEPEAPAIEGQNPQPEVNEIPPALFAIESGDSTYSGIKTLTLNSFGYNFKIKRSGSEMTQVHILKPCKVKDAETNAELVLKIVQKGSELVFEYEGENKRRGWRTNTLGAGEIEILIPDGDISRIMALSSNIELNGYTAPVLNIQTTSGNVNASDIKASLSVSCSSGSQFLTEISGSLKCNTTSGNINLKTQRGNVKAQTSSGKIKLSDSRGDVTCGSTSGNIRLDDVQGKLDLHASSGMISGESISLIESCSISAISGSIDMDLKNDASDLSFDLTSISGNLKIKKESIVAEAQKSLRAGSGKILVKASTISGNQGYR